MAKFKFNFDDRVYRVSDYERLKILVDRKFRDESIRIRIFFGGSDLDTKSYFYIVSALFINRFTSKRYSKKIGIIDESFVEIEA